MLTQVPTASPDAKAQAFLKDLRTCTASAHEQLEANILSQSITAPSITPADYRRYLQVMQRVVIAIEDVTYPVLRAIVPDLDARSKQSWLRDDLGMNSSSINPYPPFPDWLAQNSVAYVLGAFYVLEGSILGGRVILKSLPNSIREGRRYFEGYGAQTGKMWQSFLVTLSAAATTPAAQQSIINGATDTFAAINRYFDTCIAHEAAGHRQS